MTVSVTKTRTPYTLYPIPPVPPSTTTAKAKPVKNPAKATQLALRCDGLRAGPGHFARGRTLALRHERTFRRHALHCTVSDPILDVRHVHCVPSNLLSEPWRSVYAINPMVGVVEGFCWALLATDRGRAGHHRLPLLAIGDVAALPKETDGGCCWSSLAIPTRDNTVTTITVSPVF